MLGDENWIIRKLAADALWEVGEYGEDELGRSLKVKMTILDSGLVRFWVSCRLCNMHQN